MCTEYNVRVTRVDGKSICTDCDYVMSSPLYGQGCIVGKNHSGAVKSECYDYSGPRFPRKGK